MIGVSKRETGAMNAAPRVSVPDRAGWGLVGETGRGKSWAMVQAIGGDIECRVRESTAPETVNLPRNYARWINWPEQSEKLKGMVGMHYTAEIDELVEAWETTGMLFLDDLGAERVVGENDYSLGILTRVLDSRYRQEGVVYWTSNLGLSALSKIYGPRLVSRIVEAWPPVVIKGTDIRMGGVS